MQQVQFFDLGIYSTWSFSKSPPGHEVYRCMYVIFVYIFWSKPWPQVSRCSEIPDADDNEYKNMYTVPISYTISSRWTSGCGFSTSFIQPTNQPTNPCNAPTSSAWRAGPGGSSWLVPRCPACARSAAYPRRSTGPLSPR